MTTTEGFLKHYGVKGQKWGVRHDVGHVGQKATTSSIASADANYNAAGGTSNEIAKIYAAAMKLAQNDVLNINNMTKYASADFTKDSSLRQEYYKAQQSNFLADLEKAAANAGTNASGTKKYGITVNPNGSWNVVLQDVSHAAAPAPTTEGFCVYPIYDKTGHIVGFKPQISGMVAHSESDAENFLSHFGVIGMHWGRHLPGKGVEPAHEDHTHTRAALKKPTSSLSTRQIKEANQRLEAEKKFSSLKAEKSKVAKGNNYVKAILATGATVGALYTLVNSKHGQAGIKAGKAFVNQLLYKSGSSAGRHSVKFAAALTKAAARHV